jgi:hypothetical protein
MAPNLPMCDVVLIMVSFRISKSFAHLGNAAAGFIFDNKKLLMAYHGLAIGYPAASQPGNPSRK